MRAERLALCAVFASTVACMTTSSPPPPTTRAVPKVRAAASSAARFSTSPSTRHLVLVHTSDNESELLGEASGEGSGARAGGVARAAALLAALKARATAPVLVVAAGDTLIPAPELKIDVDGVNAVAASNNLLGYHASAVGNHELDLGDSFLADYLEDARFPYLTATLDPKAGPLAARKGMPEDVARAGGWARDLKGRLVPSAKACLGELVAQEGAPSRCEGMVVGLVGATTPTLRTISNPSADIEIAASLDEVRARVQGEVDRLTTEGVDVVVLLSHLQDVRLERRLVEEGLTGVDVIVAGGGDNRLADDDHRLLAEDVPDRVCEGRGGDCYPMAVAAKDGRPVVVVATDGQLRYLGHLSVSFDEQGVLTGFDEAASRPWPVDEVSLLELRAEPARDAVAFESRVRDTLAPLIQPFATSSVFLEGRREAVRNRQTNLGDLSADSIAWAARAHPPKGFAPAAFALRNGGGIRGPIGGVDRDTYALEGGPIRPIDLEASLRFDGGLVVVKTTHRALKETLEASVRGAGTGRGHFPQASREVVLEYTRRAPEQTHTTTGGEITGVACGGQRVRALRLERAGAPPLDVVKDGALVTPDAEITFATLSFLAKGGDGWFPGSKGELVVAELKDGERALTEQSVLRDFIEHLEAKGEWQGAKGYPDPVPGRAETFTRIRELDVEVAPMGACAGVADAAVSSR